MKCCYVISGNHIMYNMSCVHVCASMVSLYLLHSKKGFVIITTMYVKCGAESQELGYTS